VPSIKGSSQELKADTKPVASFTQAIERVAYPVLKNVNLDMTFGDFVTVIGKVGTGKTSLLMSIMNETRLLSGFRTVTGTISYVEQEPFILSDSVKNNIVFGQDYNKERMDRVIRVC